MTNDKTKSTYPGLTDKAYRLAMRERDKRLAMGFKSSVASVISEAVIKVFGNA